jgi:hypothetical protein
MADMDPGAGTMDRIIIPATFTFTDVTMATIKNGTLGAETSSTTNGKRRINALIGTWEIIICT